MLVHIFPTLFRKFAPEWELPPTQLEPNVGAACFNCKIRDVEMINAGVDAWPRFDEHLRRTYVCVECRAKMIEYTDFAQIPYESAECKYYWWFAQYLHFRADKVLKYTFVIPRHRLTCFDICAPCKFVDYYITERTRCKILKFAMHEVAEQATKFHAGEYASLMWCDRSDETMPCVLQDYSILFRLLQDPTSHISILSFDTIRVILFHTVRDLYSHLDDQHMTMLWRKHMYELENI